MRMLKEKNYKREKRYNTTIGKFYIYSSLSLLIYLYNPPPFPIFLFLLSYNNRNNVNASFLSTITKKKSINSKFI